MMEESGGLMKAAKEGKKKSKLREWIETIVGSVILAAFLIIFVAQSFVVQGSSMNPTLQNGERLVVEKVSYRFSEPDYGDIVVFKFPYNPQEEFIKRVIALPGDTVMISQGQVFVNGDRISEQYISEPPLMGFAPQVVPEEHYFVLGDNRNNSLDSRDGRVGFVPKDLIVGRAVWRYWPVTQLEIIRAPELTVQ